MFKSIKEGREKLESKAPLSQVDYLWRMSQSFRERCQDLLDEEREVFILANSFLSRRRR
jgi:hypothetical protein